MQHTTPSPSPADRVVIAFPDRPRPRAPMTLNEIFSHGDPRPVGEMMADQVARIALAGSEHPERIIGAMGLKTVRRLRRENRREIWFMRGRIDMLEQIASEHPGFFSPSYVALVKGAVKDLRHTARVLKAAYFVAAESSPAPQPRG